MSWATEKFTKFLVDNAGNNLWEKDDLFQVDQLFCQNKTNLIPSFVGSTPLAEELLIGDGHILQVSPLELARRFHSMRYSTSILKRWKVHLRPFHLLSGLKGWLAPQSTTLLEESKPTRFMGNKGLASGSEYWDLGRATVDNKKDNYLAQIRQSISGPMTAAKTFSDLILKTEMPQPPASSTDGPPTRDAPPSASLPRRRPSRRWRSSAQSCIRPAQHL